MQLATDFDGAGEHAMKSIMDHRNLKCADTSPIAIYINLVQVS